MNPVQVLKFAVENLRKAYEGEAADRAEVIKSSFGQIRQASKAHKEEADEVEKTTSEVEKLLSEGKPANELLDRLAKTVQELDYMQLAYFDVQRQMNSVIAEMKEEARMKPGVFDNDATDFGCDYGFCGV